jgi:glutathione synthase/RimK-type ligase-like ATP-grasp enzyme
MHKTLLITYVKNYSTQAQLDGLVEFVEMVNQANPTHELDYCTVQQLVFKLKDRKPQILLDGVDIAENYDTLLLRNFHCFTDFANAIRVYAEHRGIGLVNPADITFPYLGKVSQGFVFAYNDVPTPDFIATHDNQLLIDYVTSQKTFDYPLIVKHNDGVKGLRNFLVQDAAELATVLQDQKPGFIVQPFIENTGELRILTFPERAPLIFSKKSSGSSHLNNTARGGVGKIVEPDNIPADILQSALRIPQITGRQLGGIDVLLAKDGSWTILEVNHTPALASGMFTEIKAAALADSLELIAKGRNRKS